MKKIITLTILLAGLILAACAGTTPTALPPATEPTAAAPTTVPPTSAPTTAPTAAATEAAPPTAPPNPNAIPLVVVTHDSFAVSDDVLNEFEQANNANVQILKSGDAGAALNKAILAGTSNPLGDAMFGVDNTFLSRALQADLFQPYKPSGADAIPDAYKLDPQFRLTPIDWGDVCLDYDIGWFQSKNIPPPQNLDDLTKPTYKSLLVVENPATSSPGLAFLLATISTYGQDKYLSYWTQLRANDVAVSDGWDDAYNNQFSYNGKGTRPLVVSYATDPGADVFFSNGKLTQPGIGTVTSDNACFRQIEFAGVFKNAKQPALARKFIDFMISQRFQEDVPTQMFVFPVNPHAQLPDFTKFDPTPKNPAQLAPDTINADRDTWIKAWTQTVLR